MADNVTVSNSPVSSNADIPVRSIDKGGEQIQVVAVDYGGAGAEDLTVPDFATETTLASIDGKVATEATLASINSQIIGGSITVDGTVTTEAETVSSSSVTSTTASASSVTVLASNANRKLAILVNDSDKIAYVKLGATASTTSYSYKLQPDSTLELAQPVYTGIIDAIWETSPTGAMRVTELT